MMLTDEEIDKVANPFVLLIGDSWTGEEGIPNNGEIEEFARAVIEENTKKVLADLKPRVLVAELGYTPDQVAALIQERDAQKQRIAELEEDNRLLREQNDAQDSRLAELETAASNYMSAVKTMNDAKQDGGNVH